LCHAAKHAGPLPRAPSDMWTRSRQPLVPAAGTRFGSRTPLPQMFVM
jgi:hypothetical protein